MRITELALIPARVCADRWRHAFFQRQPVAAVNVLLSHSLVVTYSLGVDVVVVLADRHVQGPINLGAVHVELHLDKVFRLGLLDAFFFHVCE